MAKRGQRIREWAIYRFMTPIRWLFERWMRQKNLVVLYCVMGNGIGDALALSTILKALFDKDGTRGVVFSLCPDLFWNNPMVVKNLSYHAMSSLKRSLLKSLLRSLRGQSVICFGGEVWTLGTSPFSHWTIDERRVPGVAWINRLLPDGYPPIDLAGAKPAIYFSAEEQASFSQKFEAIDRPFGLVKATVGLNRPKSTALKDWSIAGFLTVVAENQSINWLQVGDAGEPVLPGAYNLLGQTSLREVLWLLSQSCVLVSVEGFLTHASAAFDVPTVVPFTGIHDAKGLLYPCTIPVLPEPMPACDPCWQEECSMPGMPCRTNIQIDRVVTAVQSAINPQRGVS